MWENYGSQRACGMACPWLYRILMLRFSDPGLLTTQFIPASSAAHTCTSWTATFYSNNDWVLSYSVKLLGTVVIMLHTYQVVWEKSIQKAKGNFKHAKWDHWHGKSMILIPIVQALCKYVSKWNFVKRFLAIMNYHCILKINNSKRVLGRPSTFIVVFFSSYCFLKPKHFETFGVLLGM